MEYGADVNMTGEVNECWRSRSEYSLICPSQKRLTPLMHASIYGHTEFVEFLLSSGAAVNATDDVRSYTVYPIARFGNSLSRTGILH
jgi:ankyrin repeat protein